MSLIVPCATVRCVSTDDLLLLLKNNQDNHSSAVERMHECSWSKLLAADVAARLMMPKHICLSLSSAEWYNKYLCCGKKACWHVHPGRTLLLLLFLLFLLAAVQGLFGLAVAHSYLACTAQTTYELLKGKLTYSKQPHPFGCKAENVSVVEGLRNDHPAECHAASHDGPMQQ